LLKSILVPIHSAGWPFIAIFAGISVALAFVWSPLGWVGAVLTLWCVYFFRNPDRVTPVRGGLVIAPADGVVQLVDRASPPPELEMGDVPMARICIFMNVFNVHVNRIPIDGTVKRAVYRPGKFFNASFDKASELNERQSLCLATEDNTEFACVQIAGLIARRIKCDVSDGSPVRAGERFGLIRFGSRVDVYMPDGIAPLVVQGQRTVAGETVLADLQAQESIRTGEIR
jgi:phosphatidylserine decarboxylase